MLYDSTFYLGHIFQAFLHDTPEVMAHVHTVLSRDDASRPAGEVRLGGCLLAWLERQHCVMDVAHKATLLEIANDFEAFTHTSDAPWASACSSVPRAPVMDTLCA